MYINSKINCQQQFKKMKDEKLNEYILTIILFLDPQKKYRYPLKSEASESADGKDIIC